MSRQLTQRQRVLNNNDYRAFEIVVDLVAVNWLYRKMIRNTPDTEVYRALRGLKDHSESIRENTRLVMESQMLVLIFLCFAGAIQNNGRVSLEGGMFHPHSLIRYLLQQVHFQTLVFSNFGEHFSKAQKAELDDLWRTDLQLFVAAGLITETDLAALSDSSHADDVNRAADIIDDFVVDDLEKCTRFLRQFSAMKPLQFVPTGGKQSASACL